MFLRYNIFGILWAVLVLILAFIPADDGTHQLFLGLIPIDKLLHFSMYMVLVFLLMNGFLKQYSFQTLNYYPLISAVVMASVYGMIIEVLQGALTLDRSFELGDIFANFTGCLAGQRIVYSGLL